MRSCCATGRPEPSVVRGAGAGPIVFACHTHSAGGSFGLETGPPHHRDRFANLVSGAPTAELPAGEVAPAAGVGAAGATMLTPGEPGASGSSLRRLDGEDRLPPIGGLTSDSQGIAPMEQWTPRWPRVPSRASVFAALAVGAVYHYEELRGVDA